MAVDVSRGSIIRATKTWKNVGDVGGARDVLVGYGTGATPETFVIEFSSYVSQQHCPAGGQVVAYPSVLVPTGAGLGLRNAIAGIGSISPPHGIAVFDDVEIVADAINIVAPPLTKVTITIDNKNVPDAWTYTMPLYLGTTGWNIVTYKGETTTVQNAIDSIASYFVSMGRYVGEVYVEYAMTDTIVQDTPVWIKVTQDCTWGMPPLTSAVYWGGLSDRSIGSSPFTPIGTDFAWALYPDENVAFMCYNAAKVIVDTPNAGQFLGWGNFINGNTYTWDWTAGSLGGVFA